jgi:glycosyltransferase involved in cell wall biosynthesis
VTAGIAAYNAERYYAEAIESILAQTNPDLELLLVVDKASIDRTIETAHDYAQRDPRVRVIEVPHCNIPTKFARVVDEARGEWVGFLDADDIALPHRFERILTEAKKRPEVVAWFGWSWQIRADGTRFRMTRHGPIDDQQFAALRRDRMILSFDHGTGLFRRDALLAVGNYDAAITIIPDYDIVDRVSDIGLMLTIPEPLMEYRLHGANTSFRNFALQSKQFDYVWHRRDAWNRGEPFVSFDEFVARPPIGSRQRRWRRESRERSRFHWNATAVHIANQQWSRAVLAAARSVLWNPLSVVTRLWRNFIRPRFFPHGARAHLMRLARSRRAARTRS